MTGMELVSNWESRIPSRQQFAEGVKTFVQKIPGLYHGTNERGKQNINTGTKPLLEAVNSFIDADSAQKLAMVTQLLKPSVLGPKDNTRLAPEITQALSRILSGKISGDEVLISLKELVLKLGVPRLVFDKVFQDKRILLAMSAKQTEEPNGDDAIGEFLNRKSRTRKEDRRTRRQQIEEERKKKETPSTLSPMQPSEPGKPPKKPSNKEKASTAAIQLASRLAKLPDAISDAVQNGIALGLDKKDEINAKSTRGLRTVKRTASNISAQAENNPYGSSLLQLRNYAIIALVFISGTICTLTAIGRSIDTVAPYVPTPDDSKRREGDEATDSLRRYNTQKLTFLEWLNKIPPREDIPTIRVESDWGIPQEIEYMKDADVLTRRVVIDALKDALKEKNITNAEIVYSKLLSLGYKPDDINTFMLMVDIALGNKSFEELDKEFGPAITPTPRKPTPTPTRTIPTISPSGAPTYPSKVTPK